MGTSRAYLIDQAAAPQGGNVQTSEWLSRQRAERRASGQDLLALAIVCGLGTLGQHCARKLKEFGTTVAAIELSPGSSGESPDASQSVDRLIVGDCREPRVLEEAGIATARAILLVAREESVNIAAAFAARSLNPSIRIVIRSAQERLNRLLGAQLGDFIALDPTQIAAPAFALESLGEEILGLFKLQGRPVRITRHAIDEQSNWCGSPLAQMDTHRTRVLTTDAARASEGFCAWEPDATVRPGDSITRLELDRSLDHLPDAAPSAKRHESAQLRVAAFGRAVVDRLWTRASQTQRIAGISLGVLCLLYLLGVALYKYQYQEALAKPCGRAELSGLNDAKERERGSKLGDNLIVMNQLSAHHGY